MNRARGIAGAVLAQVAHFRGHAVQRYGGGLPRLSAGHLRQGTGMYARLSRRRQDRQQHLFPLPAFRREQKQVVPCQNLPEFDIERPGVGRAYVKRHVGFAPGLRAAVETLCTPALLRAVAQPQRQARTPYREASVHFQA